MEALWQVVRGPAQAPAAASAASAPGPPAALDFFFMWLGELLGSPPATLPLLTPAAIGSVRREHG